MVSGPSGAGKSSVLNNSLSGFDNFCYSVSVTTREKRQGEIDGVSYFFISRNRFDEMVQNGELLEHAVYVSNGYGTPKKYVEDKLEAGINVILEIEIQGAKQIKEKCPDAVFIFIIPPTAGELRNRLTARGTESTETMEYRLKRAVDECNEAIFYDYLIINDNFEKATNELRSIFTSEQCRFDFDIITNFKEVNLK